MVHVLDDPLQGVHLGQVKEAHVLQVLAAHLQFIISRSDPAGLSRPARVRTLAKFSQMAPVELLVTHIAFSVATKQKE